MGTDPSQLLKGDSPQLVDEWQVQPLLWDLARREIDKRKARGQYIFTGSTAPAERVTHHSGARRFAFLTMSTLSLYETGESSGHVSLHGLARGAKPEFRDHNSDLEQLADRLCRGGWPADVSLPLEHVLRTNRDYVDQVAHVDITTPDGVNRNPVRVMELIQSLARNVGTETNLATLAKDADVKADTARDYLDSLARIFISVDQPAWSAHLRSKATLRESPKRHLADPALAVAALQRKPQDLLSEPEFLGQLFESFVVHELRVYTDEPIYHARLNTGLEVDAVFQLEGQTFLAEVKLGHYPQVVDAAAASLHRFADQLIDDPILLVITGGGPAYVRPDGVVVAPVTSLAP